MKLMLSLAMSAATAAAFSIAVSAQAPSPPQTPAGAPAAAAQNQPISLTGCVQREADYRRAQAAGRGGVAGTGVGTANEFVLVNAMMATPAGAAGKPTGTSGAKADAAYELTGPNEGQLEKFVGRRVEISGRIKAAEVGAAGKPTGGPTAGAPPAGLDAISQDLKLAELELMSVKEATGTCPQK